ncbi:MAG: M1 family metallopeptidase, partial [Syntrophomonadaceae bacterium]|nr:M1 family metallopeptidase [Syntrophomonadaceae bacterium]
DPTLNVLSEDWHNSYNSVFGDPFCLHSANYLIRLNTPEVCKVVSTGKVMQAMAEDNGRQTHIIQATNVSDFSLAILFDYLELTKITSQATIKAYIPTHKEEMGQKFLRKSADIINYFSCQFGSYPYEEFKLVFVPMQGFYGMEYSELIFLRDEFLNKNYDLNHSEFILAHEIAHQWWYGLVGNDQIKEPWLDEGLANWSAYKYLDDIKGRKSSSANNLTKNINLVKELTDMGSTTEYYQIAYSGGEAFWFGLEEEIGTDKVFKALRRYLAEYKYKIATTPDLLSVIETEAHKDMEYYFNKWFK